MRDYIYRRIMGYIIYHQVEPIPLIEQAIFSALIQGLQSVLGACLV